MRLPFTRDELHARLLHGQRSFDAVNLPALYALETEGFLEVVHDATDIRFGQAGVLGRVVVRLTRRGKRDLPGPGA